jgi:uncharacterized protein GlcG (DUF336 family)
MVIMSTQSTPFITTASVSCAAAAALLEMGGRAAAEMGFEAAIAVVDAGGALKAFSRSDGAAFLTTEVAMNKAWTAASSGYPTHVLNDLIADPKSAPLANLPRLMPIGGGYPLLHEGKLVGGIGISGGDSVQDQNAALAALKAVGFEVS